MQSCLYHGSRDSGGAGLEKINNFVLNIFHIVGTHCEYSTAEY